MFPQNIFKCVEPGRSSDLHFAETFPPGSDSGCSVQQSKVLTAAGTVQVSHLFPF
ncbi:MAG: hypothetical protein JWN78_40 [Bacteroidota bacterium]|nr:hypothetical protein [Bacteroidota bacterium]